MKPLKITEYVYQVGGPGMTSPEDCCVYLVDAGKPVLIDAGAGNSVEEILRNVEEVGYRPRDIGMVVLTHCHIDHVGGAPVLAERFAIPLAIHELDATAVEEGDPRKTAANWYGVDFPPTKVKILLKGEQGELTGGVSPLKWLHTPGHTPGSISLYFNNGLFTVLFGQDIHGPFYASFGSDLDRWAESMRLLLDLNADILCEGHYGVIRTAAEVRDYITGYLRDYGRL